MTEINICVFIYLMQEHTHSRIFAVGSFTYKFWNIHAMVNLGIYAANLGIYAVNLGIYVILAIVYK